MQSELVGSAIELIGIPDELYVTPEVELSAVHVIGVWQVETPFEVYKFRFPLH